MSRVAIIAALEGGLRSITPDLPTIWEDEASDVDTGPGATHQKTYTLFAEPITNESGAGQVERGIYQVNLFYPAGLGIGPPMARGDLIQSTMHRAGSFAAAGGLVVNIEKVAVGAKRPSGNHDLTPVEIHFWCDVPAAS